MATTKKYVSLEKLSLYDEKIKSVISAGDSTTLTTAKAYADGLATNYDAAGSASTVQGKLDEEITREKAREDEIAGLVDTAQKEVDALEVVVDSKADKSVLDALDAYVGDIPDGYTEETIVAYINKKAEEVLTSASGGSSESAASVLAALNTYKAENDPKVAANTTAAAEAQTAADNAQSSADSVQEYAEGVAADLEIEEKARADADTALDERISEIEGTIVGLSGAMHFEGVKDEVPTDVTGFEQGDVIIVGNKEYVFNGTEFVEFGDASVNAEAITTLTGRVSTAEGKITTLEGEMDDVQAAVDTKVEQTAFDEAIEALEGADEGQVARIAALEAKFGDGEGSVADMIADAKQEAIDAAASAADTKDEAVLAVAKKYTDDEIDEVEGAITTLQGVVDDKAAASDLTDLDGRVTTAEGEIDTLRSEMGVVETKAAANETAIGTLNTTVAGKAAQSDLEALTDRVAANETAIASFVEASEEEINALFA